MIQTYMYVTVGNPQKLWCHGTAFNFKFPNSSAFIEHI